MYTILVLCRSATLAQRAVRQLAALDCPANIVRPPIELSPTGCSYGISVSARYLPILEKMLENPGFACSGRVYRVNAGSYEPISPQR